MEIYDSEREQIDALRKWWKENGRTVIAGLVLGLGGIGGWTAWQGYVRAQQQEASFLYEQALTAADAGRHEQVAARVETLMQEFPDSGYAPLGALVLASSAVGLNALDVAERSLRWTLEHADAAPLRDIARLRLARLRLAAGDADATLALIDDADDEAGAHGDAFRAAIEEVRGDALRARGEHAAAAAAYRRALEASGVDPANRERLQMKLDDLAAVAAPGVLAAPATGSGAGTEPAGTEP